ncbi:MAG: S9 family peptidase, partial [Acidobacteria bacterium]|nr:S9 family peptidase [Acidobacteriota bacterium]
LSSTGERDLLYRGPRPLHAFLLEKGGGVAFHSGPAGSGGQEPVLAVYRRPDPSAVEGEGEEVLRCDLERACGLLALDGRDRPLLLARPEGDLWKVVGLKEDGTMEILHGDPRGLADLEEVAFDPRTHEPLLAVYDTEGRRNYSLAPRVGEHLEEIERMLPDGNLHLEARGPGAPYWLITDSAARLQHRRYYLYDTRRRQLEPLLEEERLSVPHLPEELPVAKEHFSYRASDGRKVYGFLSFPRGRDLSHAPLVAHIHGGPWSRVRQGFDPLTQFLVDRGYVVFEPNFRASTGYGLDYVLAGRGQFGDGRVHRDIADGVRHLLDRGIGDPWRVGILGHSFGGFSALGAVAFSPELFKVGIASAPAIDLLRALEDLDEEARLGNGLPQKEVILRFAVDPGDPTATERLRRASPEQHLAETARPLLILAGAKDEKIPLVDVEHYALALDGLGKDVSLLVDEDSGHGFEKPLLREAYLYLLERFFGYHLGGAFDPGRDPRVETYLEGRLLLTGRSLEEALVPAVGTSPP